ncbi:dihydromonapterin reductase [Kushneria phosphatilytica]|uniref:Dihydromonapterin reductase n=1 Tax=Kushneria phosphatilytica TaxID=657387 RepID=A0A1S1NQ39_9GAMM|nr:dihydromonapterin reductase [Kushneria phosphatilytica]OHV10489.1 dihydromonapterin reductase [Kushneria phosphatilytica]QEL11957.1 dihydromonapterin reductase [Kushneria phosphatilytica]
MSQAPILITGGAQRLGRYCAERLQDDGHPVIITYRREREAVAALRRRGVTALPADFSSEAGIMAFIDALKAHTPRLRAVIHNASLREADRFDEQAGAAFERMFHLHMQAPYLINLHVQSLLMACSEPMRDIIHMTDFVATRGASRHVAYAATKAGLESLTRSFAALFGADIKVNAIAPAAIMHDESEVSGGSVPLRSGSLMPTPPGPGVIWQSVRYLLDNAYMTGAVLPVDGGRHVQ